MATSIEQAASPYIGGPVPSLLGIPFEIREKIYDFVDEIANVQVCDVSIWVTRSRSNRPLHMISSNPARRNLMLTCRELCHDLPLRVRARTTKEAFAFDIISFWPYGAYHKLRQVHLQIDRMTLGDTNNTKTAYSDCETRVGYTANALATAMPDLRALCIEVMPASKIKVCDGITIIAVCRFCEHVKDAHPILSAFRCTQPTRYNRIFFTFT